MNADKCVLKQLLCFVSLCLPVTWVLMGIAVYISSGNPQSSPAGNLLYIIGCFMPAIAGVIVVKLNKESIFSLKLLPSIQGHVKVYVFTIIMSVIVSLIEPVIIWVFFQEVGSIKSDINCLFIVFGVIQTVAVGCVMSIMLLGEEIGWMGFLFPRLEKLTGTIGAIILTGIIRGLWHGALFFVDGRFLWKELGLIVIANIIGGSILVLITKLSNSVFPAAVFHSITNTLPAVIFNYMVINPAVYENNEMLITLAGYVPNIIIMMVCLGVIMKKRKI